MTVATKISPIRKDFQVILSEELSPRGRSLALAGFARGELIKAQEQNRKALGRVPEHETYVDGRKGAALESVRPERGLIVFEFDLQEDAFIWIHQMLVKHSPLGPGKDGHYRDSHLFLVDGHEADPTQPQLIENEAVFVNHKAYARKIEGDKRAGRKPISRQAPDGVYQVIADMAKRRFGNSLSIRFGYRSLLTKAGTDRQPAIVIKPR